VRVTFAETDNYLAASATADFEIIAVGKAPGSGTVAKGCGAGCGKASSAISSVAVLAGIVAFATRKKRI
jgi:hypothetical protein